MYGETQIRAWFGRPLGSSDVMPKILWIKENEPDVHARAHKFLTGSSYITAKLTGEYYVDKFLGLASFNPLYGQDGRPDPRLCGPVCRPDQLAKVGETTDIAGCVTAKASGETGLAEGTPVTVGTDDSGAEGISCGIGRLGDLMLQLGSSVYMFLVTDHLVSDDRIWRERFIIPGTFDVSAGTNTAGTLTRWLRDTVFVDLKNAADARGENAYAAMARRPRTCPWGATASSVCRTSRGSARPSTIQMRGAPTLAFASRIRARISAGRGLRASPIPSTSTSGSSKKTASPSGG